MHYSPSQRLVSAVRPELYVRAYVITTIAITGRKMTSNSEKCHWRQNGYPNNCIYFVMIRMFKCRVQPLILNMAKNAYLKYIYFQSNAYGVNMAECGNWHVTTQVVIFWSATKRLSLRTGIEHTHIPYAQSYIRFIRNREEKRITKISIMCIFYIFNSYIRDSET
jgi:hypothetical protein